MQPDHASHTNDGSAERTVADELADQSFADPEERGGLVDGEPVAIGGWGSGAIIARGGAFAGGGAGGCLRVAALPDRLLDVPPSPDTLAGEFADGGNVQGDPGPRLGGSAG
jgi:hypothetical protein